MSEPLKLTPARLLWLRRLAESPSRRARGRTGIDCMRAGYTEWDYRDAATGRRISQQAAREKYGAQWWEHVKNEGELERLTPLGCRVLRRASDA